MGPAFIDGIIKLSDVVKVIAVIPRPLVIDYWKSSQRQPGMDFFKTQTHSMRPRLVQRSILSCSSYFISRGCLTKGNMKEIPGKTEIIWRISLTGRDKYKKPS